MGAKDLFFLFKRPHGAGLPRHSDTTMESPPHVSYCLRCVRSCAICHVPCVDVCCAFCVVCFASILLNYLKLAYRKKLDVCFWFESNLLCDSFYFLQRQLTSHHGSSKPMDGSEQPR